MRWTGLWPSLPRLSPVSALEKGKSRATWVSRASLKREGGSRHQNPTPAPGPQKGLLAAWCGGDGLPGLTRQGSRQAPGYINTTKRGHRGAGREAVGAWLLEKHHRVTCSKEHNGAWDKEKTKEPSVGAAAGVSLSHCGSRQSACQGTGAGTGCRRSGNLGPLASLSGAQAPAGPGGGAGPARGRTQVWSLAALETPSSQLGRDPVTHRPQGGQGPWRLALGRHPSGSPWPGPPYLSGWVTLLALPSVVWNKSLPHGHCFREGLGPLVSNVCKAVQS